MGISIDKGSYAAKLYGETKGFTLVELLIVVAIIAVLAAIAVPHFTKYRLRAYKSQLDSDTKNAYTAAQAYLTDNEGGQITTLAELTLGGFNKSPDITFLNASMSQASGKFELYSAALNTIGLDNNSVALWNARLLLVNKP